MTDIPAQAIADAIAARLAEHIKDDLKAMEGTELHAELAVAVTTAIRGYLERHGLPGLCPSTTRGPIHAA